MKYIAILALFFTACSPQKRIARLAVAHPAAGAAVCAALYPVKQSVTVVRDTVRDTTQLPARIVRIDCDSSRTAKEVMRDTTRNIVYVPCPPAQLIYEKIYIDSIVEKENTAAIDACKREKDQVEIRNAKLKQTNKYLWIAVITMAVIAVGRYVIRAFF